MVMFKRQPSVAPVADAPPAMPAQSQGYGELGSAISGAGAQLTGLAVRAFEEQVRADTNGALSDFQKRLNERLWNPDSGFMHQQGERAFDADKELPRVLSDDMQEIAGKLRSEKARRLFSEKVQPSLVSAQRQVERHVWSQGQVVAEANFKARLASSVEAASLAPDETTHYIETMRGDISEFYANRGLTGEANDAAVSSYVADMRTAQIDALLGADRFIDAKAAFDDHAGELGAAAPAMHEKVLRAWLPQQALEIANDITAESFDPITGRVDAAAQNERVGAIQNARLKQQVLMQLSLNNDLAKTQRLQGMGDVFAGAYDHWKRNGRWDATISRALAHLRGLGEDGAQSAHRLEGWIRQDIEYARAQREKRTVEPETPQQHVNRLAMWQMVLQHPEWVRNPAMTTERWVHEYESLIHPRYKDFFDKLFVQMKAENWDASPDKRAMDLVRDRLKEQVGEKSWDPEKWSLENQETYADIMSTVMQRVFADREQGLTTDEKTLAKTVDYEFEKGNRWWLGLGGDRRYEARAAGTLSAFRSDSLAAALDDGSTKAAFAAQLTRQTGSYVDPSSPLVDQAIGYHYAPENRTSLPSADPRFLPQTAAPEPAVVDETPRADEPVAPKDDAIGRKTSRANALGAELDEVDDRQFRADVARLMAQGAEYESARLAARGLAKARAIEEARNRRTFLGVRVPE